MIILLNRISNGKFLYHTNKKKTPFVGSVKIVSRGQIAKCRRLFLRGGGHFAGMPMVADGRGIGVKNRENMPTS